MSADELSIALFELLRKVDTEGGGDFLREAVRTMAQALMEREVSHHVQAERYERSAERTAYRNGYQDRTWDTRVGTIDLPVPRVRDGSYLPTLREPRRRAERALVAVVQERGFPRDASRNGSRRWACRGSARVRCPACAKSGMRR